MSKTSGNKELKNRLIEIYGDGCMFEKAHIARRIENMGGIRTFKSFTTELRFKRKPISYELTLHHLQHRSEGGRTNLENGAVVSDVVHRYLHSLPREDEEQINNMLREFKLTCVSFDSKGIHNQLSQSLSSFDSYISIPLKNNERPRKSRHKNNVER